MVERTRALPSLMTLDTFMSPILIEPSSAKKQLAGLRSEGHRQRNEHE